MAVGSRNLAFAVAEVGIEAIGHLLGDFQGLLVAGDLVVGHAGLDVVAHHVHLMALLDLAESRALGVGAGLDLERGVQIAVLVLSAGDQIDQTIAQILELRVVLVGQRIGGLFQPLVHVGILEDHAIEIGLLVTGHHAQIAYGVAPLVRQCLDLHAGGVLRNINALLIVDNSSLIRNHFLGNILAVLLPERRSHRDFRDHRRVLSFVLLPTAKTHFIVRKIAALSSIV